MLGGYKQSFVCTRTQGKGRVSPQETEPDLPVSVQESQAEVWVHRGLLQGRGTEHSSACKVILKQAVIIFIAPTMVWPQAKKQRGSTALAINRNCIKYLLSRPSLPHIQSLPSRSFHKPLTLIHQRADRMKTTITENKSNLSHGP